MPKSNVTKKCGFTLIELIVVITIISIISVVAAPRFFGKSSFDGYILRDLAIHKLRQVQMLAINNTDKCYRLAIRENSYSVQLFDNFNSDYTCSGSISKEESNSFPSNEFHLTYNASPNFVIDFNNNGVVTQPLFNCQRDTINDSICIAITGGDNINLIISREGYIYGN